MAYVRKVRTTSGAVAVQVARKERGKVVILAHLGSAHTDAELGILLQAGRQIVAGGQAALDFEVAARAESMAEVPDFRAERALILVPASLTHQWLVELLRRFSLSVTLLDEQQSQAHSDSNPFDAGQLVLASQDWLFANPHRQSQAEACQWDLLIVDEAHHPQLAVSVALDHLDRTTIRRQLVAQVAEPHHHPWLDRR